MSQNHWSKKGLKPVNKGTKMANMQRDKIAKSMVKHMASLNDTVITLI